MSNRLKALREKKAETFEKLSAITDAASKDGNRSLTEQEGKDFSVLERDITSLSEDIRREEFIENEKKGLATPIVADKRGEKADVAQYHRAGKLFAFKGADAEKNAFRSGQWLAATMFGNEKAAQYCRDNGIGVQKAQSEGVNTAGGFLVEGEMEKTIIDLREEYGTFRSFATVRPDGERHPEPAAPHRRLTAYWVAEAAAATESQKSWDNVSLVAKKLMCYSLISTELSEDAFINVADDLANEMAYAFAVAEDAAGWNGDGTSTYGGIRGVRTKIIDGTHTASAIDAASGHDTFAEYDATDLVTIMSKLPKYARRNARWYTSTVGFDLVFQRLTAAAGGNSIMTLGQGLGFSYLGYPDRHRPDAADRDHRHFRHGGDVLRRSRPRPSWGRAAASR
jgi:HK97 family phage major capsid protein